jgi:hypothetical protein
VASVAQDRRPDWLAENLRAERGQHDEAELKTFIKDHIKAYALGIQCLLAVVLCLQVVCVVRLFWGQ